MRKTAIFLLTAACLLSPARAAAPEVTAQPGQVDPYKTRSELLMEASGYTGVPAPEQAAAVWAEGLKQRSAALQYVVMIQSLKNDYARQLDALGSNWVTGMSSPWVQDYAFIEVERPDGRHANIVLEFALVAAGTPPEYHLARLGLVRENSFWRIERIRTDSALYPYTLYRP